MKIFLYYEDNEKEELHKTLKITLPKSWKSGPSSKLLSQFIESYNASLGDQNTLVEGDMHLETTTSEGDHLVMVPSDAIVDQILPDRANIFVKHGPSITLAEAQAQQDEKRQQQLHHKANTVQCTHFGCKKRFPKGGPYPECHYHAMPPVFHETAKYWACCPQKKAYDWNDFEAIPGCQTGVCSEVKEDGQKLFLGGTDLRAQSGEGSNLRSIDDFNRAQAAGTDAAPILDRLERVMVDLGIDRELYLQVVDGMKKELQGAVTTEAELLEAVKGELGAKLKDAFKAIAVQQLKIK
jgi:hypothetical protein